MFQKVGTNFTNRSGSTVGSEQFGKSESGQKSATPIYAL
jgi:hypothetical protein